MDGALTGSREPFLVPAIRERCRVARPARVLDLGFGEGRALLELAWEFREEDVELYGVDGHRHPPLRRPEDLAISQGRFGIGPLPPRKVPVISFRRLGMHRTDRKIGVPYGPLPYDDRTFDLVYSAAVIRLIHDKAMLVEDVCRVLRPGGLAVLELDGALAQYPVGAATPDVMGATWSRFLILDGDRFVPTLDHLQRSGGDAYSIHLTHPTNLTIAIEKHAEGPLDLGLEYDLGLSLSREQMPLDPGTGKPVGGARSVYRLAARDAQGEHAHPLPG